MLTAKATITSFKKLCGTEWKLCPMLTRLSQTVLKLKQTAERERTITQLGVWYEFRREASIPVGSETEE